MQFSIFSIKISMKTVDFSNSVYPKKGGSKRATSLFALWSLKTQYDRAWTNPVLKVCRREFLAFLKGLMMMAWQCRNNRG